MGLMGFKSNFPIPLFFVYMATLMHTYLLERYFKPDIQSMRVSELDSEGSEDSYYDEGFLSELGTKIYRFIRTRTELLGRYILHFFIGCVELVSRTISATERAPHWIKVTVPDPPPNGPISTWQSYSGVRYLQYCLQTSVDWLRFVDIDNRKSGSTPSSSRHS